jgi:hypothetical protein
VYILAVCSLKNGYPVAASACKYDAFKIGPDRAPPNCPPPTLGVDSSGKKFITQTIQDPGGMDGWEVVWTKNVKLELEGYFLGTAGKIKVTGTKIKQALSSVVRIRFTDVAGNSKVCDPVLAEVRVPAHGASRPVVETLTGLSAREHRVTIRNGSPGLRRLTLTVNGARYAVGALADGATRTIDVRAALRPGTRNTMTLRGHGPAGATASVLISN